jgi:dipeptidyl aminopeptidase/acylaminoacyl peptidase
MKKSTTLIAIIALFLLSSCAFNNKFLGPTKYDSNTKAVTVSKTKTDSIVAVYNGNNFQPTFLKNGIDSIALTYTLESVIFKSANGNNLNGWMLKPKGTAITHTILHFHGNGGNILGQFSIMKPLLAKGFQVFVFDYSGFGFSEGKATRKNLLKDGISAVNYLKNRADVKDTKFIIYGQSYGGHLAICVAEKMQNKIDGLVSEGAFSSHKDIAADGMKNKFTETMARLWVKDIYSAKKAIAKIKKPILIIHSSEDKTIPFAMGKKLFEKAIEPKAFMEVTGGHILSLFKYADEISEKIKKMGVQ